MADTELNEYIVVVDAVNVTTGYNPNNHEPIVARLERGAIINSPASNQSVQDLLGMGGIVLKADLKSEMKSLRDKGSLRRPTVVSDPDAPDHLRYRVTAAGAATAFAGEGDPVEAGVDDVAPLHADYPDLSTTEVRAEGITV